MKTKKIKLNGPEHTPAIQRDPDLNYGGVHEPVQNFFSLMQNKSSLPSLLKLHGSSSRVSRQRRKRHTVPVQDFSVYDGEKEDGG